MYQKQQYEQRPRPGNRWYLWALTLAIALLGNIPSARALVPGDYLPQNDPQYVNPLRQRLAPQSQGYVLTAPNPTAPFTWGNGIPNALADYYTYAPLRSADAVKIGFPAACGDPVLDPASTADCYVITAKRLNHNFELKSILDYYVNTYLPTLPGYTAPVPPFNWPGTATGLKDPARAGVNFSATQLAAGLGWVTDTYGYGSGGTGWRPPYIEPGTFLALNPAATITGSAPAFFKDFPIGLLLGSTINGIPGTTNTAQTGIWHFPAPSIKGTSGRPVLVQWLNELPNIDIPGTDPTLDCSDLFPGCFPYNRITTHVHGAHVGPGSDGLASADYNPNFSLTGGKYTYANTSRNAEQTALVGVAGPKGTHIYPMTQEAGTIWYHDHAMGLTHLNTNQGLAGFFPITDANEKCLQGIGFTNPPASTIACTQVLPTGAQELGFALQDRLFDDKGQFYMPDAPTIDANFPTCDQTSPASRAATCSPLFMYVKHAANTATLTPAGIHLVSYDEATLDTTIAENDQAPLLGPSTTLEYFGNMPVVNGVVYGKYDVDRKLYRMRFLGGTDSRTWTMQLNSKVRGAATVSPAPIPFYVIGTEQGFLNNPVQRTQITLMPGERVDVLVDFRAVPPGDNQVILANYAPDAPYQAADNGALATAQAVDIPEIMAFDVSAVTDALMLTSTNPATSLRILSPAIPALPGGGALAAPYNTLATTNNVRVIALEEITDEFGRIMPTIDRRGYESPGVPATEIIMLNDVEEWDIVNTTADAHPMHLHLVAFQVVSRTPFDLTAFFMDNTAAVNDTVNNVFLPPTYVATGPPIPPGDFENGWKDTVFTPPGFVTKVRAKFDLAGEYVWHCHILSHEEHDMMRPMKTVSLTANVPSSFAVPAAALNDRTAVVNIGAPAVQAGVTFKYVIEYSQTNSVVPDTWHPVYSTGQTPTIAFPRDGVYALRVKSADAGISPIAVDSAWVNGSNSISVSPPAGTDVITLPVPGVLTATSQIFTFTSSGAYPHTIWVGTTPGGSEIGKFKQVGTGAGTITATGLPTTGAPLYVRLIVSIPPLVAGDPTTNRFNDYVYTAFTGAVVLNTTATAATGVTSSSFNANWGTVAGATGYYLDISTSSTFATFITGFNSRNVANVLTYQVTGLSTATTYYYRVRAYNGTGTGAVSNVISVNTSLNTAVGIFRGVNEWYLDKNGNGIWDSGTDTLAVFGFAGVKPVTGNWSGLGGSTRIGSYDPATFTWYLDVDGDGIWNSAADATKLFGFAGVTPVTGNWNGLGGTTKIGIYDPATFNWYLDFDGDGYWNPAVDKQYVFGLAGIIPVTGDWNGDGTAKIGIYDPATYSWYLDYDGNGIWNPAIDKHYVFGYAGIKPVTGDWNSTGTTKIGIYDPASSVWYKDVNGNGLWDGTPTDALVVFGLAGSTPVTGSW